MLLFNVSDGIRPKEGSNTRFGWCGIDFNDTFYTFNVQTFWIKKNAFLYILNFFFLCNALCFALFGYLCEKLWLFEVKWVPKVCFEVWIAVVCVVQHMSCCAQVLQVFDAII